MAQPPQNNLLVTTSWLQVEGRKVQDIQYFDKMV